MDLEQLPVVAQVASAVGTVLVAVAALIVSVAALRTQRAALDAQYESLPLSVEFEFTQRERPGRNGARWILAQVTNTGPRAYVHDVFPFEWQPVVDDDDGSASPDVARPGLPESLPPWLRGASRRARRSAFGLFRSGYLPSKSTRLFWFSCPRDTVRVQLVATVGATKNGPHRFVDQGWMDVPS